MAEEASLEFRLKKQGRNRWNWWNLLDEIKNNDLISEKYNKTYKYLN